MSVWKRLFSGAERKEQMAIQNELKTFETVIMGTVDDSVHFDSSGEETHAVETALKVIEIFLNIRKERKEKAGESNFPDEVHRGIKNGDIVLRYDEDLDLFLFIHTHKDSADIVPIARHYIKNGEMLGILHIVRRRYFETPLSRGTPFEMTVEQLEKIYEFDMAQLKTLRSQGDDEDSMLSLPLEVRAHFAGCFDDPLENEEVSA